MPSSGEFIEVVDAGPTRLSGVRDRMLVHQPAFATVAEAFEEQERSTFDSYDGKYVQTGALKASLTQTGASGAVRRPSLTGFDFGTEIPYARFQGTSGPGNHQPPSAILKATQTEAALAARSLLEYVLHGAV